MTYHLCPPNKKKIGSNGKNHHAHGGVLGVKQGKPPAVELKKFQVGSFYLQHLYLGPDGWWGCKAGGSISNSQWSCVSWQQLLSLKRLPGAGMLLRSQLIIALRSSPRWMSELVLWARNLFDLFEQNIPSTKSRRIKEHVQAEMNLRNRAYFNFLWPRPRARAKKKLELCIFWGGKLWRLQWDWEWPRIQNLSLVAQHVSRMPSKVAVESISKVLNVVSQKVPIVMGVDDRATSLCGCFGWEEELDDLKSTETIRTFMDDIGG